MPLELLLMVNLFEVTGTFVLVLLVINQSLFVSGNKNPYYDNHSMLSCKMCIAEMTILLTLSVYHLTMQNQLPAKSGAIPLIS